MAEEVFFSAVADFCDVADFAADFLAEPLADFAADFLAEPLADFAAVDFAAVFFTDESAVFLVDAFLEVVVFLSVDFLAVDFLVFLPESSVAADS